MANLSPSLLARSAWICDLNILFEVTSSVSCGAETGCKVSFTSGSDFLLDYG